MALFLFSDEKFTVEGLRVPAPSDPSVLAPDRGALTWVGLIPRRGGEPFFKKKN